MAWSPSLDSQTDSFTHWTLSGHTLHESPRTHHSICAAQVAEAFGIDHVMHVAGSGIDGFGARSYGLFNTLLYDHADPGPQPCFVLSNITQLPAVLGF